MSTLDLLFQGKSYTVPKRLIYEFLEHSNLFHKNTYEVESTVPLAVFEAFVESLRIQQKPSITQDNAAYLSRLSNEFRLADLALACAVFSPESLSSLSERVATLERQISSPNPPRWLGDRIASHDRRFAILHRQFDSLKQSFTDLENKLFPKPTAPPEEAAIPAPSGLSGIARPLSFHQPLEGIIALLTAEHKGNVHEKGVVMITSKSAWPRAELKLQNVADLSSKSRFQSHNAAGQWVCWEFPRMLVRLTDYTIESEWLKSWAIEGSLDGENWMELDRHTNTRAFERHAVASFPVGVEMYCRFVRLMQTGENHQGQLGYDSLILRAVEFFGTLYR
jgi:hypothetical protein